MKTSITWIPKPGKDPTMNIDKKPQKDISEQNAAYHQRDSTS